MLILETVLKLAVCKRTWWGWRREHHIHSHQGDWHEFHATDAELVVNGGIRHIKKILKHRTDLDYKTSCGLAQGNYSIDLEDLNLVSDITTSVLL